MPPRWHRAQPPIPTGAGSAPYTLAISPDGKTAWVVNYEGSSLVGIDTATNQVTGASIPIPANSYGIGITPDGTRAYVAATGNDVVLAIDLLTRQQIGAPIPVGDEPAALSISPDGKRVYVSNGDTDGISVIDTATNQVVGAPIVVGNDPYGSAITPDGKFLFVAIEKGVAVVDTAAGQLAGPPIPLSEADIVAISPNGARAYVSEYGVDRVTVIDTATRQVVGAPIPVSEDPEYLAVTPDGKRLLVEHYLTLGVHGDRNRDEPGRGAAGPVRLRRRPARDRPRPVPRRVLRAAENRPPGCGGDAGRIDARPTPTARSRPSPGISATAPRPRPRNRKPPTPSAKPGEYPVALTVTDNEGCSVALVFTGQTASCHGSPPGGADADGRGRLPRGQGQLPEERQARRLQVQAEGGQEDRQRQEKEAEGSELGRQGQGQTGQVGDRLAEAEEEIRQSSRRREESAGAGSRDGRR